MVALKTYIAGPILNRQAQRLLLLRGKCFCFASFLWACCTVRGCSQLYRLSKRTLYRGLTLTQQCTPTRLCPATSTIRMNYNAWSTCILRSRKQGIATRPMALSIIAFAVGCANEMDEMFESVMNMDVPVYNRRVGGFMYAR